MELAISGAVRLVGEAAEGLHAGIGVDVGVWLTEYRDTVIIMLGHCCHSTTIAWEFEQCKAM